MKRVRLISMTVLALFLGTTASSVYAQEEKHPDQQTQPAKTDEHAAKPEKHAAKSGENSNTPAKQQQQAKVEKQAAKPNEHSNTPAKQQQQAKAEEHPQKQTPATQQQGRESQSTHVTVNKNVTVVNGERRIPDATFRTSFGREHTFTVNNITVISGQPRFQYGGYWLGLGVPWPVAWAYADPVYVEFVDGQYYLFNPRYAGVRVEIILL
jgi:outer membrane biosynthesis protein TonB